jgi:glycosyltransferase involved in cell wall biosynthesis
MSVVLRDPSVSVLLPVYNCERYIGDSIASILSQTFVDYEIIIIDDGSTDRSSEIVQAFQDPRLNFIRQDNRGLAATLNRGISLARGRYIARQDQDDLSHPDRLALQVAYMESHPRCGLLGTWAQIMEGDTLTERFHRHPVVPSELRYHLLFNNPFVHSSVLLRRSVLEAIGGYSADPARQPPEDYELWSRISRQHDIANLPQVLLNYREIPGSMSRVGPSPFREKLIMISSENIAAASNLTVADPDIRAIAAITHGAADTLLSRPDFRRMQNILFSAISKVACPDTAKPLRRDAIDRIHYMRASWLMRESHAYALVHSVAPLRNLMKRLWRLLWIARRLG